MIDLILAKPRGLRERLILATYWKWVAKHNTPGREEICPSCGVDLPSAVHWDELDGSPCAALRVVSQA